LRSPPPSHGLCPGEWEIPCGFLPSILNIEQYERGFTSNLCVLSALLEAAIAHRLVGAAPGVRAREACHPSPVMPIDCCLSTGLRKGRQPGVWVSSLPIGGGRAVAGPIAECEAFGLAVRSKPLILFRKLAEDLPAHDPTQGYRPSNCVLDAEEILPGYPAPSIHRLY
jgi:hypothetical protein